MPTTTGFATDLITFSRGSLATVTDSDGKIKWAHHNLLLASEQLDTSSWTKTSATIAANSIAAPDSAITADTIVASGANGTVLQSYTAVAVPYVFGVWLRRKTGTGNIQIAADNGTYTTVTITNDWALYTVTQTPTAGTKSAGIRIVTNGDEVYAWGAHLYRSDLGGMQANASMYPYYNPSTPKNLLGYSEAFDNAAWVKDMTVTANAATAPNGSLSADLLSGSNGQFITQTYGSAVLSSPHIASVYVKANTISSMRLAVYKTSDGTFGYVDFNLASQTAGTPTGSYPPTNATITSVGDGWYRCSFKTAFDTGTGIGYAVYNFSGATGSFYAWGAQLSDSASLDPYMPNFGAAPSAAAAHGPRLDYDPSTLAAKGLLVEEQRTNLLRLSADFSVSSVWNVVSISVSANVISAPDGTTSADKLIEDTSTGLHRIVQSSSITSGTTYTFSVYVKSAERTIINLQLGGGPFTFTLVQYNLSAGTSTGGTITPVGGGWYRCTASSLAASTGFGAVFVEVCDSSGQRNYTGDGFSGVYVWGAQVEAGAFATSYIPTAAATVTRNADVASVATSQFPYSATEGTLVANVSLIAIKSTVQIYAELGDGTYNNRMAIYSSSTTAEALIDTGGSRQATLSIGSVTSGSAIKSALAYKLNDIAACLNGGSVSSDTSALIPIVNLLAIGNQTAGFADINGHIRQITYIPRRLTNAELIARST